MPVMGYPVRGSSPDKTTVEETVDNLSRWKTKNITLVWDRGFVSKPNIDYARKEHFHVLSGGPHTSRRLKIGLRNIPILKSKNERIFLKCPVEMVFTVSKILENYTDAIVKLL